MNNKIIHHPHDKFFRKAMSDVRVARDFFKLHLPEKILNLIDLNSLELKKETFIDDKLKYSAADVLYQTRIEGSTGFIYVLVEHQSTQDSLIGFRLLKYTLNIMQRHMEQYNVPELPIVYPLVFYSGKNKCTENIDFFELFGNHKDLARNILLEPFQLVAVNEIEDEKIREYLWIGIAEFVFKYSINRIHQDFEAQLGKWLVELEKNDGFEYAKIVIKYLFNMIEKSNQRDFFMTLKPHLTNRLEGVAMTIAEQLKQEGMQQGRIAERNVIARQLLLSGMKIEQVAQITQLTIVEVQHLALAVKV